MVGAQGASSFTVSSNVTNIYVVNRALALTSSGGVQYGYVSGSAFNSSTGLTTVNVVSDNINTALTFTNDLSQVQYATLDVAQLPLITSSNLAAGVTASLNATSVAMAVALG